MSAEKRDWIRRCIKDHEGRLISFTFRLTGDLEQARDIVQESFLELWDADDDNLRDRVTPWLYTVCRNKALNVLRRENKVVPLQDRQLRDQRQSACSLLEQRQSAIRLEEALGTLPKRDQELLTLKYQNEMTYKEISEVTGLSITNVGYHLHMGLKALRSIFCTTDIEVSGQGGK